MALLISGLLPYISTNEIGSHPMTHHFYLDLKSGDGGRPAKVEWIAGTQERAEEIVTEMYGDDFTVTYSHSTYA